MTNTTRQIVLIWLFWALFILGYMQFAPNAIFPNRLEELSQLDQIYLKEPFLNSQVAWDSEYYLSIATAGYDDPDIRSVEDENGETYSASYAFFPLYPYVMKVVRLPFLLLGFNPIAASTAAGVIVSLLGTLGALLALYDLLREYVRKNEATHLAFLVLIFPSAVFLAVVYSEGLFLGLTFGSLAMMRRKQWIWAGILAAFATWTRSVGIGLFLSLLIAWGMAYRQSEDKRALLPYLPFVFAPVIAYGVWYLALGYEFNFVQWEYFGNSLFNIRDTVEHWLTSIGPEQEYPALYFQQALGLGAVIVALISCFIHLRTLPYAAIFGIFALIIPMTSGVASSLGAIRYVLIVPTFWLSLVLWSRGKVFKLVWMAFSALLLALYAFLFSVDMWAG